MGSVLSAIDFSFTGFSGIRTRKFTVHAGTAALAHRGIHDLIQSSSHGQATFEHPRLEDVIVTFNTT